MTRPLRLALAAVVVLAFVLALAALSALPLEVQRAPEARLRVAFSARPERIESCRRPTADELANLPAHMRQTEICEGTTARYRLEVRRGDSLLLAALVRGGGLRHDRQLYVLREVAVPSGTTVVDVRLARLDSTSRGAGEAREDDEPRERAPGGDHDDGRDSGDDVRDRDDARHRRMADEVPPALHFRETVELRPREVLLVTYDQSQRRLRAVRGMP